jgi:predicted NAD/FAD-dependent oxidoreductase
MIRRLVPVGEREAEFTINDCNVYVPEDANRLLDCHDEWSAQIDPHQFDKAQAVIITRPASLLAALLSSSFGLFLK